jgi:hypothetical protein
VDGEDDPIKAYFDTIECVKPGDSDEVTIELENVGCVDGMLDLLITITESDENIAVEPELNAGDVADDLGDNMDGELAAELEMKISADLDGDTVFETVVAEGAVGVIDDINYVYGALNAGGLIELKIEWWVDSAVGNTIMTDTLKFDIEFSLDQAMEACLSVVSIDQPDQVQECETVDISVEVKNTGGAPGECDLNVTVTSPEGVVASAVVPTGMVNSLETVTKLVFDDLHIPVSDPPLAVPYTVTVSVVDCCSGEEVTCEIEVTAPPALHVVDMIQPATAFWCDELIVEVGVHNDGGKPGECLVNVVAVDAITQDPIMAPIVEPVPVVAPCDTVWVAVNLGHVEEYWPGMIVVVAWACADDMMDPYICLPPIGVAPPPAVPGVGSTWTYDVVYDPGSTETTIQTATLVARGLGDPIPSPATACLTPPSGQAPYFHLSWADVSTCTCQAVGGCAYDGTDSPLRSMSGGTMSMIMMGTDSYAREANLVDMYSLAPACAAMTAPAPMSNVGMVAEVKSDGYTAIVGSIGYPYSVGDKWEYINELDTYLASFGMCASALAPLPPSLNTAEVMAVGVTNPDGGFTDCVQIDTYSIAQIDNDKDGLYNEDPVDGVDNDGDTLVDEDPMERDVTMQDNDGDSAVNEDPIDGVDNDGDTVVDEDPVDVICYTSLWWSPTALGMVETHNPCSYDLQENKVLTSHSLVP